LARIDIQTVLIWRNDEFSRTRRHRVPAVGGIEVQPMRIEELARSVGCGTSGVTAALGL
jgi:hypothetical protein